jgi:hypothetical protein
VLKMKFVLPMESWISNFVFAHGSTWCYLQCDHYNLNVKFLIFFKKFILVP